MFWITACRSQIAKNSLRRAFSASTSVSLDSDSARSACFVRGSLLPGLSAGCTAAESRTCSSLLSCAASAECSRAAVSSCSLITAQLAREIKIAFPDISPLRSRPALRLALETLAPIERLHTLATLAATGGRGWPSAEAGSEPQAESGCVGCIGYKAGHRILIRIS